MDSRNRPVFAPPAQHPSALRSPSPGRSPTPQPSHYTSEPYLGQRQGPPIPSRHPTHTNQSEYSIPPTESHRLSTSTTSTISSVFPSDAQSDFSGDITDSTLATSIKSSPSQASHEPVLKTGRSETVESAFEKTLSERELRDLYDDEEVDRFLRLFSAHVQEVKLRDSSSSNIRFTAPDEDTIVEDNDQLEDAEWTSLEDSTRLLESPQSSSQTDLCLSEIIAINYVIPLLPSASLPPPPPFTLGRLQRTTQRLFLALEPGYKFFISHLLFLATWQDKQLSLKYCIIFWSLWFGDLLLPFFMLYLLYTLLYHKIHPAPTYEELREHRQNIDKAKDFGDELQTRLQASPVFGVKEAWRIFHAHNKSRKSTKQDQSNESTVSDDPDESVKESNVKALVLEGMTGLADSLERLKNIFLWRQSISSRNFCLVLGAAFLMTLLLPARYLAKLVYFVGGFAFWHVPPIFVAIPPEYRRRFLNFDPSVPTDADYAMELISRRVAEGQEIRPLKRRKDSSPTTSLQGDSSDSTVTVGYKGKDTNTKRRFKKGAAMFSAFASRGAKTVTEEPFLHNAFAPEAAKQGTGVTKTYPAQYRMTPGAITITSNTLYFTTLMSSNAKVSVPLDQVTGIKKGFSNSISVQLKDTTPGGKPQVEKFSWVYERDDLFARLVASGGRQWLRV